MKYHVPFECGKTTCAVKPGDFCRFVGTKSFGTKFVCMLFNETPLFAHSEGEKSGWLARCHECSTTFTSEIV